MVKAQILLLETGLCLKQTNVKPELPQWWPGGSCPTQISQIPTTKTFLFLWTAIRTECGGQGEECGRC